MNPTAVAPRDPGLPAPRLDSSRSAQAALQSKETLDVSYNDGSGKAFHLTIERETSLYAATYDATASVGGSGANSRGQRTDAHPPPEVQDLAHALQSSDAAVAGFRQLLHRMLKIADKAYGEHFGSLDAAEEPASASQAQVVAASETVTVRMDAVDPEYWSVENTAGRLTAFALSLYKGGDKDAHVARMVGAMEKGLGEAQQAFGSALPDIARQTLDLAKQQLTAWAAAGSAAEAPASDAVDLVA